MMLSSVLLPDTSFVCGERGLLSRHPCSRRCQQGRNLFACPAILETSETDICCNRRLQLKWCFAEKRRALALSGCYSAGTARAILGCSIQQRPPRRLGRHLGLWNQTKLIGHQRHSTKRTAIGAAGHQFPEEDKLSPQEYIKGILWSGYDADIWALVLPSLVSLLIEPAMSLVDSVIIGRAGCGSTCWLWHFCLLVLRGYSAVLLPGHGLHTSSCHCTSTAGRFRD
eukprot:jgi/Botrbrau1/6880/Bobra.67_3s0001.1